MASLAYTAPSLSGKPGVQAFNFKSVFPAQGANFRRGDFLQSITTGTIVSPAPTGAIAAVVPTAVPTVNPAASVSAGTARQVLYAYYTYTNTGGTVESLPSAEFLIVNTAGYTSTVTVPSAGSPAGSGYFVTYVGIVQGGEWQQIAIGAPTALGSAATVPYPLTNSIGANRAATNASTNILGLAVDDYDVYYTQGQAAAFTNRSPFGADVSGPPMGFYEQYQSKIISLSGTQLIQMSLVQPWYPGLLYTGVGLYYSTTYNCFAADNSQSNKILTIVDKVQGPSNPNYDSVGGEGDTGARVVVQVTTTSALIG